MKRKTVTRSIRVLLVVAVASCTLIGLLDKASAQQFPANQPPVENPLPQYRSSGPTGIQKTQSPPAIPDFFQDSQPVPVEQLEPLRARNNQIETPQPRQVLPLPSAASTAKTNRPTAKPNQLDQANSDARQVDPHYAKHFTVDYSIYRDRSPLPIDPRKPCPICYGKPGQCDCRPIGNGGRPWQDQEPGGCQCDQHRPWAHPDFSVHWPRPFSAKLDQHFPQRAVERYLPCPQERIVDVFDPLANFKLINYQRKDNGYCGPGADRFGCLGEPPHERK